MNLKLILKIFALLGKFKDVNWSNIHGMGWMSITGAIISGLGFAAKALSSFDPSFDVIGDGIVGIGAFISVTGLRRATKKTDDKITALIANPTNLPPSERGEPVE